MKRPERAQRDTDDTELDELQNPDSWDFETAELRQPVKHARAVVSVAFPREDYERVAALAQRHDMRTSEYIREAALGRIAGGRSASASSLVGSTSGVRERNFTGSSIPYSVNLDQLAAVESAKV